MEKRIVVIATDGMDREDGNIYYSRYVLVSTDDPERKFEEPVFNRSSGNYAEAVEVIRNFGYTVEEPDYVFTIVNEIE